MTTKKNILKWGKHKGLDIQDDAVETQYLKWLAEQPWMTQPHNARLLEAIQDEIVARGSE